MSQPLPTRLSLTEDIPGPDAWRAWTAHMDAQLLRLESVRNTAVPERRRAR